MEIQGLCDIFNWKGRVTALSRLPDGDCGRSFIDELAGSSAAMLFARLPQRAAPYVIIFNDLDATHIIKRLLQNPSVETTELVKDYNPQLLKDEDLYKTWLDNCSKNAKTDGAPLLKWIEEQPILM